MKRFINKLCKLTVLCVVTLVFGSPNAFGQEKSYIIGFHQRPTLSDMDMVKGEGGKVKRKFKLISALTVNLPDKAVERLKKHPRVKYVVENAAVSLTIPDMTAATSIEYSNSWGAERIEAGTAHRSGIDGNGVKVAVIDTGIDYNHSELKNVYGGGYDIIYGDPDPFDDSFNSHGTHVSGIIAAAINDTGIVGISPSITLYAVKVLDGAGFGSADTIIGGIQWAVENGMNIANISIAGYDYLPLREACDAATASGLLIIAAAGNTNGQQVQYPARYDSVVAVTGTDQYDEIGKYAAVGSTIELAAPGSTIYSTRVYEGYSVLSGTSQATAFVTGVAALILQSGIFDKNGDGKVNTLDIRKQLQDTAEDLGSPGRDIYYGYGLVNAARAIAPPKINLMSIENGSCSSGLISLTGKGFVQSGATQPAVQFFLGFQSKQDKKASKLANLYSAASSPCSITSVSDTDLKANCGTCNGSIRVSSMNSRSSLAFSVGVPDVITNEQNVRIRISDATGSPGQSRVIRGRMFGKTQRDSVVSIGSTSAQVVSWDANRIEFIVPDLPSGVYPLTVQALGRLSNSLDFTLQ